MPTTFELEVDPAEGFGLSGTFAPWRIGLGGSGSIVFIAAPIVTGTLTANGTEYDMSNSTVYISLKLEYVPQVATPDGTPPAALGLANVNNMLQTNDLVVDPDDRTDIDPAVVVQNLVLDPSAPPTSYIVRALMVGALQQWFNDNIVQFSYIFATVSLNEQASDSEAFQWLKPTYTGYAYLNGPTEETAYFAVLSMTGDRSPAGLSFQMGPGSIPAGSTAAFNISMSRYVENVIFPGLVKGFPNATPSSFTLTANNTVIENTQDLQCDDIRVGAIDYTPYIKQFTLQVVGSEIQVYTKTVTNISPGIRSVVTNTSYQTIVLVDQPSGSQTLDFVQARDPQTNSWVDTDVGITVGEILISIAGAVAGIVAAKVITGIVKIVVACVIIAIVFGLAGATPALIAKVSGGGAAEALPSIDLMVLNATSPVAWPGSASSTLQSAAINGAFQLGGDPNIKLGGDPNITA